PRGAPHVPPPPPPPPPAPADSPPPPRPRPPAAPTSRPPPHPASPAPARVPSEDLREAHRARRALAGGPVAPASAQVAYSFPILAARQCQPSGNKLTGRYRPISF